VQHLDPDRLVLLALSEESPGPGDRAHLDGCAACRDDLAALSDVAGLGAQSQELYDLPAPPERVWDAIEAQILPRVATPVRRSRRRWAAPVLAAAMAAVVAVAGTVAVERLVRRDPAGAVTARATLTALPAVPVSAGGTVRVRSDGQMEIDVRNLPLTTGFHEVWLIDPDDPTRMVSVGNLGDRADVVLPLPTGTDLRRYRLVDVSDEPHDGDAAHSGNSLLRGILTS
jgi:anti-sigma-K factor RskA